MSYFFLTSPLHCGVVQVSKLSGLLYTIYTNEVPILQNILTNQEVCNEIGAIYYEKISVDQCVVNFVYDNNSVITANPGIDIENYTNDYFKLLEIYYNSQKLRINTDKSQLLVCSMSRFTIGTDI